MFNRVVDWFTSNTPDHQPEASHEGDLALATAALPPAHKLPSGTCVHTYHCAILASHMWCCAVYCARVVARPRSAT